MAQLYYHNTFFDVEEVSLTAPKGARSQSCPPCEASEFRAAEVEWHAELHIAKLNQGGPGMGEIEWPALTSNLCGTYGSYGHPSLCGRPCVLFLHGSCESGEECSYCHLEHTHRTASLDKRQRDVLQRRPFASLLALLLPYVRKHLEKEEMKIFARPILELLEREMAIRSFGHLGTVARKAKVPYPILQVIQRMPLSSLVGLSCQGTLDLPTGFRQFRGHMQKVMKQVRANLKSSAL